MCACHQATFIFLVGGHVHVHHVALLLCIAAVHHASPRKEDVSRTARSVFGTRRATRALLCLVPAPACQRAAPAATNVSRPSRAITAALVRSGRPPLLGGRSLYQEPAEPTLARMALSRSIRGEDRRCAIPALWCPVPTPFSSRGLTRQVCLGNPIIVARVEPYVKCWPASRSMMMGPPARKSMIPGMADYVK
jgi:hypothetical protein